MLFRSPNLTVEQIRGNVETRIRKMEEGAFGGIVLANAGLTRLGLRDRITSLFGVDEMLPAAGQGIVAIEALASNRDAIDAAKALTHEPSALAAQCERGVLQQFGERLDCYSCIAVHATRDDGTITIRAFLSDFEATKPLRVMKSSTDAEALIVDVARELMEQGAVELLQVKA